MENITSIKERMWQYVELRRVNKAQICKEIGVNQSVFAKKNIKSGINSEAIVQFLITFNEINPDWLLLGQGPMLRADAVQNCETCPQIMSLQSKIIALQERLLDTQPISQTAIGHHNTNTISSQSTQ